MSTDQSQSTSETDIGECQPIPEAPDIVNEARRIGLQPTVAYVPRSGTESAEEKKKRLKREQTRRRRTEAQARGFQQINIPEVPVEKVEAVRSAVAAILAGDLETPPVLEVPPAGNSYLQKKWPVQIGFAVIAMLAFVAGMAFRNY